MNYLNKKIYLWVLVLFSILVYFIASEFFLITENTLFEKLRIISIVVMLDGILIWSFVKYWWKWDMLYDWFVPFPNLNGTWIGKIKSNYIDKNTNTKIDEISATLTIKQSFVYIHCLLKTDKMESSSFVSQFDINKEKQRLKLVYSYGGETNLLLKDESPTHFGTAILNIEGNGKVLKGSYWTDRYTTGELNFELQDD